MSVELWHKCLRRLEGELSGSDLSQYLRPLQPSLADGQLTLVAPNRVVLKKVKDEFLPSIKRGLVALAGDDAPRVDVALTAPAKTLNGGAGEPEPEPAARADSGKLDPKYTFETFIEGKSNAQARAHALNVADAPGGQFNPLLIYGESGLGKTHLMHAIGNRIRLRKPRSNVLYVGAERFFRDMVNAIQKHKTEEFKAYYRSADALLIDDIQFFAGKEKTQEEFFHTFNELIDGGQQMVLTADKYPAEMDNLDKRLKTRFTWGLSVEVEPPELETRAAILLSKSALMKLRLPDEVALFVAQRIRSDVRALEGALNRLFASAKLTGRPLNQEFAKEILRDMLSSYERQTTIDNIKKHVAEYYNISIRDLSSASRSRSVARPRQLGMALAKELTQHSLPEIGRAFGKDHTTVLHACRKIEELRKDDSRIHEDYENLMRKLSS